MYYGAIHAVMKYPKVIITSDEIARSFMENTVRRDEDNDVRGYYEGKVYFDLVGLSTNSVLDVYHKFSGASKFANPGEAINTFMENEDHIMLFGNLVLDYIAKGTPVWLNKCPAVFILSDKEISRGCDVQEYISEHGGISVGISDPSIKNIASILSSLQRIKVMKPAIGTEIINTTNGEE